MIFSGLSGLTKTAFVLWGGCVLFLGVAEIIRLDARWVPLVDRALLVVGVLGGVLWYFGTIHGR